ncbi:hypothetical protein LPJ53_001205 [Coemansia erecta]|uniref:Molybdenum cofactor sulfurase n=1 Tax=Coemansia erecta TaxID=147472 RepID=A0A9W7Y0J0_9FUNG|nr:hypothetical protein LPJ53_001205 [Coemansia erecta]
MYSSRLLGKILSCFPSASPLSLSIASDADLHDQKARAVAIPEKQHQTAPSVDDYGGRLDAVRLSEYPQLFEPETQQLKTVFLDHTGSTLCAASHIRATADELLTHIPANPHSQHVASQWTHLKIEQVRDRLLQFFGTTAERYAVVFTANATAAIRLAGELTPMAKPGVFCYSRESHTSVVGVRNLAAECDVDIRPTDFDDIETVILPTNTRGTSLLAYPAQCNFSGQRFPMNVASKIDCLYRRSGDYDEGDHVPWWVLVDAAGYASSSPLNLDALDAGPDFVAASMYKIFGAPTGLGVLLVNRASIPHLKPKRYFGGGTVANLSFDRRWQEFRHDIESRLEDGTVNFQAIVSLNHALDAYTRNFGSIDNASRHIQSVTDYAVETLRSLSHDNGSRICHIYGHDDGSRWGPVVAFNLKDTQSNFIGYYEVERLAVMAGIALRAGRFCNPGASQKWLQFTTPDLMRLAAMGYACGDEHDLIDGRPVGALRISFGAMSCKLEIDMFAKFLVRHYHNYTQPVPCKVEKKHKVPGMPQSHSSSESIPQELLSPMTAKEPENGGNLHIEIEHVVIYPVKSCHGWIVPRDMAWELTYHGLRFDRAFVIMRHNTSAPMQQKRYPRMALIRPHIDLSRSLMVLEAPDHPPLEVSLLADSMNLERTESLVCGNTVLVFRIVSDEISSWLSSVLGVSCYLACDPQLLISDTSVMSVDVLSQADTLSSGGSPFSPRSRRDDLAFVNEAQLLMVTSESAAQVDRWVKEESNAGDDNPESVKIGPMQYRPNLVVRAASGTEMSRSIEPFEELKWTGLNIGDTQFQVSGPCRRCQMIGVNQESAHVLKEPFSTLARRMRVDGQVVFGVYLDKIDSPYSESGNASAFIRPGAVASITI